MFVVNTQQAKQERFDQMNEEQVQAQQEQQQQPASFLSSLEALLALRDRIEKETPSLTVLDVCAFPSRPFLKVKDTAHDIVIGFSSEADYRTYLAIVPHGRTEVSHHA